MGAIQIPLSSGLSLTYMNHAWTWLIFNHACSLVIIRNVYIDILIHASLSDIINQIDAE